MLRGFAFDPQSLGASERHARRREEQLALDADLLAVVLDDFGEADERPFNRYRLDVFDIERRGNRDDVAPQRQMSENLVQDAGGPAAVRESRSAFFARRATQFGTHSAVVEHVLALDAEPARAEPTARAAKRDAMFVGCDLEVGADP